MLERIREGQYQIREGQYQIREGLDQIRDGQDQIVQALPFMKLAVKQVFRPPTPSNASRGSNKQFRDQLIRFYGLKPQNDMVNARDDNWQF